MGLSQPSPASATGPGALLVGVQDRPAGGAGRKADLDLQPALVDQPLQRGDVRARQAGLDEVLVAGAARPGAAEDAEDLVVLVSARERQAHAAISTAGIRSAAPVPGGSMQSGSPSGAATVPADSAPAISIETANANASSASPKATIL